MKIKNTIAFPTSLVVHWVTGPVECCKEHAEQLVKLAKFLGNNHIVVSNSTDENAECSNCVNENDTN